MIGILYIVLVETVFLLVIHKNWQNATYIHARIHTHIKLQACLFILWLLSAIPIESVVLNFVLL